MKTPPGCLKTQSPRLFINAEPGAMLTGPVRDYCRQRTNQQEVTVTGSHFIQEDSAAQIGQARVEFLAAQQTFI